ncbi:MAG TPA: GtrA family protein [Chitinophagales bacterium]|nr:GtrA family protein [Chitinophagales bacterium]
MAQKIAKSAPRFLVAGGISTSLNYSMFYILHRWLQVNVLVSAAFGYVAGVAVGFLLNHYWTYSAEKFYWSKAIGYLLVYLSSLGVSTLFLHAAVNIAGLNAFLMNLVAIGISTSLNFIGLQFFTYKK